MERTALTAGYSPIFYKSVDIEFRNGATVLIKEYGPLHILFYIEIGIFLVLTFFALIYGWIEKPNVSRKNLVVGAFLQMISMAVENALYFKTVPPEMFSASPIL